MRIQIEERDAKGSALSGWPFFAAGFRPFFLFAGLSAGLAVPVWLALYTGAVGLALPYAPMLWHGHEMLFGFGAAAVAGFLLTAVPNWTGAAPLSGLPLMLLAGLWLAGRVAMLAAGLLPPVLVAVVDIAFLPILAASLIRPLMAAGKLRNLVFVPVIGLLALANLLVHLGMIGTADAAQGGLVMAVYILVLMITVVGGRIVPAFTATALRMAGGDGAIRSWPWLERAAPAAMVAAAAADLLWPGTAAAGVVLLAAAAVQAARLSGWRSRDILAIPLVWVLHAAYAWLVLGLALRGASSFIAAIPPSAALHALTTGAVGMMVLGVMTRAALGHGGRPLVLARPTVVAYWLVGVAALVRVAGPILLPTGVQEAAIHLSGTLFAAGYLTFVAAYWPILTRPRADGRPG